MAYTPLIYYKYSYTPLCIARNYSYRNVSVWLRFSEIIRLLLLPQGVVVGQGEDKARKVRVTLMRYMNLAWIILMRKISDQIAIRFREAREEEEAEGEEAEQEEDGPTSKSKKEKEEAFVRDIFVNFNCDKSEKFIILFHFSISATFFEENGYYYLYQ